MTHIVLRKRKLGKTSATEIASKSTKGIVPILWSNKTNAFQSSSNPKQRAAFPADADVVFRWGCTANIPEGATTINKSRAIHGVSDKLAFRQSIAAIQPHWPVWSRQEEVRFPCVVRPKTHHQGRHLYVCRDQREFNQAIRSTVCMERGWYAAPLVNKVAEYRVFVVSGRVVCVARKHPADANTVAWNVAQGGRFENVRFDDWPLKAVRISIEAFLTTGLDFGGVDIMVDAEEEVYVLEVNSAPSLTSPYRQQCFAKAFDYIIDNGPDVIPLPAARGGYRKFIHPAITDNATV
jgi:glutathione synthase/RimK-type ligase-like ATP-grasp enzyme